MINEQHSILSIDILDDFKCIAYIYKQNEKSRHLLKKIGFKKFDESFFYGDEGYIFDLGNLQNIYFVLQ